MKISNRANDILESPLWGKILQDRNDNYYQWQFSNDKKLTVSYISTLDEIRIPLMDTIALMLNEAHFANLFLINQREVENFLRDQNDIPAFQDTSIELLFENIMRELTSALFKYHYSHSEIPLSFIGKNQFWNDFFQIFRGVEFVKAENTNLYFFNQRSDSIVSFNISE
jgi:hypothetical protein